MMAAVPCETSILQAMSQIEETNEFPLENPQAGLVDRRYFLEVALGDREFAYTIIEKVMAQSQFFLADLSKAMEESDFWRIKQVLQQMKSQALIFGSKPLAQMISRLERANVNQYEQYQEQVVVALGRYREMLQELEGDWLGKSE